VAEDLPLPPPAERTSRSADKLLPLPRFAIAELRRDYGV